jgi:hypothetical protein
MKVSILQTMREKKIIWKNKCNHTKFIMVTKGKDSSAFLGNNIFKCNVVFFSIERISNVDHIKVKSMTNKKKYDDFCMIFLKLSKLFKSLYF